MAERTGPTPLPEVSSARGKVLSALAAHEDGGRAPTIAELAESLGGHPNTTRAHLGRLVDDGLVERVGIESGSRGRPAHGHRLTQRGRLALDASRTARPVSTDELVLAIVAAMVFLRIRTTYFCGACDKMFSAPNFFAKEVRCPHCNYRLR